MKKLLITIYIILFSISPIFAQMNEDKSTEYDVVVTETEDIEKTSSNSYFDLTLEKGSQNPLNKKIPFTLTITPKIDSPKTQILWDTPIVFSVETKHREFVDLDKDVTYTFTANIKPNRGGSYNIAANVISWQHDTNKTNTVTYTITLNNGLTVQPVDSQYTLTILILIVSIILLSIVSVFLIIKGTKKLIVKLRKWLTPPF
ncbi:MAG: hypothetical protein UR61_C0035G0003 [candidate division WS6 bacterium GW2011_GWE1_34_7]|uniref:Uncharacterized protein n=1 Tax=candidate division WS6 bacterium GW2011_GWE1_34_7 TaxID=1619093 RepID=A0A0G0B6P3_9BACT|nr:MAG: hypothetical protein UR61_C0035G0003 [candidate division WS6 bacterium GW2011_GWE1_34_7]